MLKSLIKGHFKHKILNVYFIDTVIAILCIIGNVSYVQARQRNTIYIMDCTSSMSGFNGAPDIWQPTKDFLKSELEKEAKENPTSTVTILPFQHTVLNPIRVDLDHIAWPNLEKVLDGYVNRLSATNICDSWLEAEKYIDQSKDNFIVLLTDGHDNVGGSKNEAKRTVLLGQILRAFCNKFKNSKGFYVELTKAAILPQEIQEAISECNELYKIDATAGIPSFTCCTEDIININTRDLPTDITLAFSNSGTFETSLTDSENPFVTFSMPDHKISGGKAIIHIESKLGDNIETLNKAIGASTSDLSLTVQSDQVIITNPEIEVVLHTAPLRSLDMVDNETTVIERVKPFLWLKANEADTLRWNLKPAFSQEAIADRATAMFRVKSDKNLTGHSIRFNGNNLTADSVLTVCPERDAVMEIIIPQSANDGKFNLTLTEISANNLDRINGVRPEKANISLTGTCETSTSLVEIIFWTILGLVLLGLTAWFGFIRDKVYPKFKKGIITVQSPYFATIRVKGYRQIVISPNSGHQGLFDKVFKGKILYHTNHIWPCEVDVAPSGKNMRFSCPSGVLISDPTPLWIRGMTYKIVNPGNSSKIEINVN